MRACSGGCVMCVVVGTEESVQRRERSRPVPSQVHFQVQVKQGDVLLPTVLQRRSRAFASATAARDGACSAFLIPPESLSLPAPNAHRS